MAAVQQRLRPGYRNCCLVPGTGMPWRPGSRVTCPASMQVGARRSRTASVTFSCKCELTAFPAKRSPGTGALDCRHKSVCIPLAGFTYSTFAIGRAAALSDNLIREDAVSLLSTLILPATPFSHGAVLVRRRMLGKTAPPVAGPNDSATHPGTRQCSSTPLN